MGLKRGLARMAKRQGYPGKQVGMRLHNRLLGLRYRIVPWKPEPGRVHWLFVATFPNGGSTAFAQLLLSASAAVQLNRRAEGQWLMPALAQDNRRWDPTLRFNYEMLRTVWLHRIRKLGIKPCVVVEKSPPNMLRMRRLMAAFGDMPTSLLCFTRDPYAVCSSWSRRYSPSKLASTWSANTTDMDPEDSHFFRALGDIYGQRATILAELKELADATVSYEELTEDTDRVLANVKKIQPMLTDARADAQLRVKDYVPQPLRNMNDEQVGRLTTEQLAAITAGLEPYAKKISALGYNLR